MESLYIQFRELVPVTVYEVEIVGVTTIEAFVLPVFHKYNGVPFAVKLAD
jgi:hypothetical protein